MSKALGMVEYKTVASGMTAADIMIKTAAVEVLEAMPVCPGKYLVTVAGDLSSVRAAVDAAAAHNSAYLIDSFVLGNPHESIFGAIKGANDVREPQALGILETFTAASAIVAADTTAKTADVDLIELRLAKGLCGKSYLLITGDVASVTAAIEKAKCGVEDGMFLDCSIIARPDKQLWESIL